MKNLQTVSLRQAAVFIPASFVKQSNKEMTTMTSVLVANSNKLGFTFSEELIHALNGLPPTYKLKVLEGLKEVTGVKKNWTPLVKGWDVPTGESLLDHIVTLFANALKSKKGVQMPCGHLIPTGTFPLERYNGCPFCGTPFEYGEEGVFKGQGSKLKVLQLWTEKEAKAFFENLLSSKTALDATQVDSLKILLKHFELPTIKIGMKETLMLVIEELVKNEQAEKAQPLFQTPTDILRYLWYKKTGFLQIVEPKTILKRQKANHTHIRRFLGNSEEAKAQKKAALKLKYSRKECRMVAAWLNKLSLSPEKACEMMHPKRGMWVRFIRALRLAEYSKRKGYENLAELLDVFYNKKYTVWQGQVSEARLSTNMEQTFTLLKQRPGVFARSLFSNMLWFGPNEATTAFAEVIEQVPARLVFTLNSYAQNYFGTGERSVQPLGGTRKRIPANQLMELYNAEQLNDMKEKVEELCLLAMRKRFAAVPTTNKSIYIDPQLFNMPVAIGERSTTIQDLPVALMGTKFPVEGEVVRLFMQWGEGLPAQHLDMDLSCHIAYATKKEICSYSRLVATGCKHSGDIQSIPKKVGTAEYIDVDVTTLAAAGAKYVTFTCNAYSKGSITPNLIVGWMNSKHPMKISKKTGVAYDPSCVQHQVRVTQQLTKGLVFGVLDVAAKEITWLELSFGGQVVQGLDAKGVELLLAKLNSRLNIGALLQLKAGAQNLVVVEDTAADEVYDMTWAMDAAKVSQLLVD